MSSWIIVQRGNNSGPQTIWTFLSKCLFLVTVLAPSSPTYNLCREQRSLLEKCASTALNSKLIAHQKGFFSKMVVDAVMLLDELLPLNMIGIKKVQGGSLEVSTD